MLYPEDYVPLGSLICLSVVWLLSIVLTFFYLAALGRALEACGRRRRVLEPGLVWLNLVPLFHLFWKFWTTARVGASLRREFDARGLRTGFAFGQTVGMLMPVVAIFTRLIFWAGGFFGMRMGEELAFLVLTATILLGVFELVLMIYHWSQVSWYARQLSDSRPAADATAHRDDGDGGARDFDEDYRPIPRRRT